MYLVPFENVENISERPVGEDGNYYACNICGRDGTLLCCEACPGTYHLHCLSPALEKVPDGVWLCHECNSKEKESADSTTRAAVSNSISPHAEVSEIPENRINEPEPEISFKRMLESGERQQIKVYVRRQGKKPVNEEEKDVQGSRRIGQEKFLMPREVLQQSLEADNSLTQNCSDKEANSAPEAALKCPGTVTATKEKCQLQKRQQANSSNKKSKPSCGWKKFAESSRRPWLDLKNVPASNAVNTTDNLNYGPGIPIPQAPRPYTNFSGITVASASSSLESSTFGAAAKAWSAEELDDLWIAIRKYGECNWHIMLRDPKLRFSKLKAPEDLAEKWQAERLKILHGARRQSNATFHDVRATSPLHNAPPLINMSNFAVRPSWAYSSDQWLESASRARLNPATTPSAGYFRKETVMGSHGNRSRFPAPVDVARTIPEGNSSGTDHLSFTEQRASPMNPNLTEEGASLVPSVGTTPRRGGMLELLRSFRDLRDARMNPTLMNEGASLIPSVGTTPHPGGMLELLRSFTELRDAQMNSTLKEEGASRIPSEGTTPCPGGMLELLRSFTELRDTRPDPIPMEEEGSEVSSERTLSD